MLFRSHVWEKGEYEPDGSVSFDEDDVEIIGEGGKENVHGAHGNTKEL